jgi:cell division septum initiation protein DivIVA
MEMNPQRVRSAEFKTVRKGADLDEVRSFLNDVADELERAQNQSTAMEARARAAVARLQELSDGQAAPGTALAVQEPAARTADEPMELGVDQSETISRTLLLAQRTADSLIVEARAEASRVVASASDEAAGTRDSTRAMAASMLDEARDEARRSGEAERLAISSEVESLKARRDFLESDVDHLEQFLIAQRSRLRDAATDIIDVTERVPAGLGDVRRPLLSASESSASELTAAGVSPDSSLATTSSVDPDATQAIDLVIVTEIDDLDDLDVLADPDAGLDPDDATPVGSRIDRLDDVAVVDAGDDDGIRFTFDDEAR